MRETENIRYLVSNGKDKNIKCETINFKDYGERRNEEIKVCHPYSPV